MNVRDPGMLIALLVEHGLATPMDFPNNARAYAIDVHAVEKREEALGSDDFLVKFARYISEQAPPGTVAFSIDYKPEGGE